MYLYLIQPSLEIIDLSVQLLPARYFCTVGTWFPGDIPFWYFSLYLLVILPMELISWCALCQTLWNLSLALLVIAPFYVIIRHTWRVRLHLFCLSQKQFPSLFASCWSTNTVLPEHKMVVLKPSQLPWKFLWGA